MFVWFCWTMLKRYFPQEQFSDDRDSPQSQFTGSKEAPPKIRKPPPLPHCRCVVDLVDVRAAYTPLPPRAGLHSNPTTPPPPPSPASRQPDICPPTSYLYLRHPHHDFGQCLIRTNVRPSITLWNESPALSRAPGESHQWQLSALWRHQTPPMAPSSPPCHNNAFTLDGCTLSVTFA